MARKAFVTINRKEINSQERFVLCVRTRSRACVDTYEHLFFSGHRVGGTNRYVVRVYDRLGYGVTHFEMVSIRGHFQILGLNFFKRLSWKYLARFYREFAIYRANDLLLAYKDCDTRDYITLNEAAAAIQGNLGRLWQREGLEAAIAFAASKY